jgi:AcrR family transcriptional regulator
MDKRDEMVTAAAQLFAREGLRGIGIDHISASVGASTRTLYKHFGCRDGLVLAALEARHRAFMDELKNSCLDSGTIASLFDTLERWFENYGASGCLLLRAASEYRVSNVEIVALVSQQKREFLEEIARRVHGLLGYENAQLCLQIWILFEGATAVASLEYPTAVADAKAAALSLLANAQDSR